MEIEGRKQEKHAYLFALDPGDLFKFTEYGELCMKISNSNENYIRLHDGEADWVNGEEIVIRVKAKLVIEE